MPIVYIIFEDYLDSPGGNEILAVVENKSAAQKFIEDYKQDTDNDTYMCDIYYEEWDITNKYADFKQLNN